MSCIKKLGERVKTKAFEREVVELNVYASILNRITELGCPETVVLRYLRQGFWQARSALYLCNKIDQHQDKQ